jgi:pyruvate dehydrogenase E1 component alpha subunit/2-oxoisovalerate dehydrogenase E1 component alpha subunit
VAAPAARQAAIPAGLTRDQLLDIYYYLRLTRGLEDRLGNLYRQSKVIGGLYRSLGQEGESVASAYALEPGDIVAPLIRNLGSMLVMGAAPVDLFRQYMAKGTGPTGGRDTNVHFADLGKGYIGNISHLGDMVPVLAGIALSFKLRRERRVGLIYIGDGGASTGSFHEGMNFAAVQRLPLVVIIEHNGYSYSTPTSQQTAVERLALKAKAYGVPAETVDGNDIFPMYEASRRAVERARRGEGVTLIEAVTYRRKGHAEHDDQRYQPKEEQERWARNDPIDRYLARLRGEEWADQAELEAIAVRAAAELDQAMAHAESEPFPEPADAVTGVLAEPPAGARLWYRKL